MVGKVAGKAAPEKPRQHRTYPILFCVEEKDQGRKNWGVGLNLAVPFLKSQRPLSRQEQTVNGQRQQEEMDLKLIVCLKLSPNIWPGLRKAVRAWVLLISINDQDPGQCFQPAFPQLLSVVKTWVSYAQMGALIKGGGMYYVSHIWCNWCRRRMFQEKHSKWKRVDKCKIFSFQESTLISISANNGFHFFQVREGKSVSIHFDEERRGQTKAETQGTNRKLNIYWKDCYSFWRWFH